MPREGEGKERNNVLRKGGEKFTTVAQVRARHPERLILHAVKGMIPKNRLGRALLKKLKVYRGADHPHQAQRHKEEIIVGIPMIFMTLMTLWALYLNLK